jgi:hypothetical protein
MKRFIIPAVCLFLLAAGVAVLDYAPPLLAGSGLEAYNNSIDYSCAADADCAVKDVGNCCGHYPMCVNKGAKTDRALVGRLCAESGAAGVCGFPSISGCRCINKKCEGYYDAAKGEQAPEAP